MNRRYAVLLVWACGLLMVPSAWSQSGALPRIKSPAAPEVKTRGSGATDDNTANAAATEEGTKAEAGKAKVPETRSVKTDAKSTATVKSDVAGTSTKADVKSAVATSTAKSAATKIDAKAPTSAPGSDLEATQQAAEDAAVTTSTAESAAKTGDKTSEIAPAHDEAKKVGGDLPPCDDYDASPAGSTGFMAKSGREYYILSLPKKDPRAAPRPHFYQVLSVALDTGKLSKVAGLTLTEPSLLFAQGEPAQALGIFSFDESSFACRQGKGSAIAISFMDPLQAKTAKVFSDEIYRLVSSQDGFAVADLLSHLVKTVDLATFRIKTGIVYPVDEMPLYYARVSDVLVTMKKSHDAIILSKTMYEKRELVQQAKLVPGTRVLKDGTKIAFLNLNPKTNEALIQEKKAWSDGKEDRLYRLKLPAGYAVEEATFQLALADGYVVVTGATKPGKGKRWDRAFLYHLADGKLVTAIKVPAEHYVATMDLHAGKKVMVAVVKHQDESLVGVNLYYLGANKWTTLKLPE